MIALAFLSAYFGLYLLLDLLVVLLSRLRARSSRLRPLVRPDLRGADASGD